MKIKIYILCLLFLTGIISTRVNAQNYTLNPYNLNVTGTPGDFLLSGLTVSNPNAVDITIFINRIERTLPNGWTSCLCFPICLAPWIDTLSWTIPANSSVDISPNFQTTPNPGFGTVRLEIANLTSGSSEDTITFTGNTLSSGIDEIEAGLLLYPNPVSEQLFLEIPGEKPYRVIIFDLSGKQVYLSEGNIKTISFRNILNGNYLMQLFFEGSIISRKIIVSKQ